MSRWQAVRLVRVRVGSQGRVTVTNPAVSDFACRWSVSGGSLRLILRPATEHFDVCPGLIRSKGAGSVGLSE
jgi:hypothetical protein